MVKDNCDKGLVDKIGEILLLSPVTGTIISVMFEENIDGHDCGGLCKSGHGWNFDAADLELIKPITPITPNDLEPGWKIKTRDGTEHIVDADGDINSLYMEDYRDDLTDKDDCKDLDIMQVWKPTYTKVYDRKEVEKNQAKEMTIAELEEKLGHKIKIVKEVK